MLCDICQVNEATILYTEIMNGTRKEQHLCEECAAKYTGLDSKHFAVVPGGLLANLLANMILKHDTEMNDKDMKKTNYICPSCGMTYNEFLKYGKLGCHDCYKTYGLILEPCLKEIQGSSVHTGKVPKGQEIFIEIPEFKPMEKAVKTEAKAAADAMESLPESLDASVNETKVGEKIESISDVEKLKGKLKTAVASEEYEEAARLRDLIRDLTAANEAVKHE